MKERRCSSSSDGRSIFNTSTPHTTHNHSLSIIFPRRRCIRSPPPPMGTFAFPSVHSSFNCSHFASLSHAFLPPSQVIVMNISFFNHFMWFIVSGCQGQSGATWRGILHFILLCFVNVFILGTVSVCSYLFTSSCWGNYKPRQIPSWFTIKLFIKIGPQKRMRTTKEKGR